MSEFEKLNGKWIRNNSDGTKTLVTYGDDGYFHWTQNDGKKVRSKSKYRLETKPKTLSKPKEESFWSKAGNFLKNATIGAMVAELPAYATAAGWQQDSKGNWNQNPDTPGATELRHNLPYIGASGLIPILGGASPLIAPGTAGGTIIGGMAGYNAADLISLLSTGRGLGDNFRHYTFGDRPFSNGYLQDAYRTITDFVSDPTSLFSGGASTAVNHAISAGLPAFMLSRMRFPAFKETGKEFLRSATKDIPEVIVHRGVGINFPKEWGIPAYNRQPLTMATTFVLGNRDNSVISSIGEYSASNPLTARAYPERYFDEGVALRFGFGRMGDKGFGFSYDKGFSRKDLAQIWESPSTLEALELIDTKYPGRFTDSERSLWADMYNNRSNLIDLAVNQVTVRPDFVIRTEGLYKGKPLILHNSYIPGKEDLIKTDYGAKIVVTPELVEKYGGATYDAARGGYVLNKPKSRGGASYQTDYTDTNELGNWISGVGSYDKTGKRLKGTATKPLVEGRGDLVSNFTTLAIEGVSDANRITSKGSFPIVGTTYIVPRRVRKRK